MSFSYRPALDGVRAVAVGLVLLFHAGVSGLGGGYIGVDIFFVLSGFLVSNVILSEIDETGSLRLGVGPVTTAVLALGLSGGLAALSARVLETPIRRAEPLNRFRWRTVLAGLATSAVVATVLVPPALGSTRHPAVASGMFAGGLPRRLRGGWRRGPGRHRLRLRLRLRDGEQAGGAGSLVPRGRRRGVHRRTGQGSAAAARG